MRLSKEQEIKETRRTRLIAVIAAGGLLYLLFVVAMLIPLRPKESVTEKRKLAEFPEFHFATLFSGEYFSDISAWFSDTVPLRDTLTSVNGKLQNFLGTATVLGGFQEGGRSDIPDAPAAEPATLPPETESDTAAAAQPDTEPATEAPTEFREETPTGPMPIVQKFSGVFMVDNAAYEYYNFVQSAADSYAAAVNTAAAGVKSGIRVFDMVIPTSTGIMPDKRVRDENSDDQKKAISYISGCLSDQVEKVEIYDELMQHRDEYIYFRTDHHWTALGSYYAYRKFCEVKGVTPVEPEACEKMTFEGFLGTFYNETRNEVLSRTPDYVDAFTPPGDYKLDIPSSNVYGADMIYDETNAPAGLKYSAFIWGDNDYTVIEDKAKETGESCILVKESFGNALAPWLAYNYKYVYVIDYRYYNGNIVALANELGVNDVIFANNTSMTRAQSLIDALISRVR